MKKDKDLGIEYVDYTSETSVPESEKVYLDQYLDQVVTISGIGLNTFEMNGQILEAIEDREDGYRSCLAFFIKRYDPKLVSKIPPIECMIHLPKYQKYYHTYDFVSLEGAMILRVGTSNSDDYYPSFHFEYCPEGRDYLYEMIEYYDGKREY